jgi:hypothetical protein
MLTNTLHLPRRHRRPLLFPPGLLALAWLLWLGCVALPQMRGMERPEYVMQMTVPPPVQGINEMIPLPVKGALFWEEPYMAPLEVAAFRPWQDVHFTGNLWNDYFSLQQAHTTVKQLQADPDHDRGLRIKFEPQATYSTLVQMFDLSNVMDVKRYWLDIRHSPTTLYMFTTEPPLFVEDVESMDGCLLCNDVIPYTPKPTLQENLVQFFAPLSHLFQHDWRNSTLLLLLMALLSAVRLGRRWRLG